MKTEVVNGVALKTGDVIRLVDVDGCDRFFNIRKTSGPQTGIAFEIGVGLNFGRDRWYKYGGDYVSRVVRSLTDAEKLEVAKEALRKYSSIHEDARVALEKIEGN